MKINERRRPHLQKEPFEKKEDELDGEENDIDEVLNDVEGTINDNTPDRGEMMKDKKREPKQKKKMIVTTSEPHSPEPVKRDHLGVAMYIPNSEIHARQFLGFLFASWRYMVDHEDKLFENMRKENMNRLDLLVFCHPNICKHFMEFCTLISNLKDIHATKEQRCWAVVQPFETEIKYTPLNSYIMFKRDDVAELPKKYKYILRTDADVFLSPPLFVLKPHRFLFGQGGYSDPFNMERLKMIAKKIGLTHRGVHHVGSTMCGETNKFIEISLKAYNATKYMFLNEFDPKLPGLETIDFKKNIEGEWIRWWRPVSSMYGGELAVNDALPDISLNNKGQFDASSCSTESIWKTNHIHCWHNPCHFSKFEFDNFMHLLLGTNTKDMNNKLTKELVRSSVHKDVRSMTMQEYSSYIAYNAVTKYLKKYLPK